MTRRILRSLLLASAIVSITGCDWKFIPGWSWLFIPPGAPNFSYQERNAIVDMNAADYPQNLGHRAWPATFTLRNWSPSCDDPTYFPNVYGADNCGCEGDANQNCRSPYVACCPPNNCPPNDPDCSNCIGLGFLSNAFPPGSLASARLAEDHSTEFEEIYLPAASLFTAFGNPYSGLSALRISGLPGFSCAIGAFETGYHTFTHGPDEYPQLICAQTFNNQEYVGSIQQFSLGNWYFKSGSPGVISANLTINAAANNPGSLAGEGNLALSFTSGAVGPGSPPCTLNYAIQVASYQSICTGHSTCTCQGCLY